MNVLSFGCGINSMAILVLHEQGKIGLDHVIFADTKCELPETYEYLEKIVKPLCRKLKLPFHIVSFGNLYEDYFKRKIMPFRTFRSCTDKYKIRPITKFIKDQIGKADIFLGIDCGEIKRATNNKFKYPLIDLGLDREDCKKIIKEADYPIPNKSGCFFCPFTPFNKWKWLYQNHKDLFEKAIDLEKNCSLYPKRFLSDQGRSLEKIMKEFKMQRNLLGEKL